VLIAINQGADSADSPRAAADRHSAVESVPFSDTRRDIGQLGWDV
jgi:hypothetical protein